MSERMCIVTRSRDEPANLIRFVCGPDGAVVPDIRGELPGRGVWVKASRPLVAEAVKRKLFRRGLGECGAPEALPDQVEALLRRAALDYMALANKAGVAVAGFEKVAAAIAKGRAAVLIEASDGSQEGRRKLIDKDKRADRQTEIVTAFDSAALGLAFGRPHVIHAALAAHGLTRKFVAAARRFEHYRGMESENLKQV